MPNQYLTTCCDAPVESEAVYDHGDGIGRTKECPNCRDAARVYQPRDEWEIDETDEDHASESEIYHAERNYEASRLR